MVFLFLEARKKLACLKDFCAAPVKMAHCALLRGNGYLSSCLFMPSVYATASAGYVLRVVFSCVFFTEQMLCSVGPTV
jgi:hypothetical protein